jgi:tetratricopeptide (TPR) repeat protein
MHKCCVILLLLLGFQSVKAGNVLFGQANQAYHNQNYAEAANTYMQIINDGFTDAAVYYNAGNSYYKLNKFGWAIWCYNKALQYEPNNKTIKENIALAKIKLAQPKTSSFGFSFKGFLKQIVSWHTANKWALGMLLAFSCALLFSAWRNLFNTKAILIAFKKLSWAVCIIYVFGTGLSYYFNHFFTNAIIVTNSIAYNNKSEQGIGKMPIQEGSAVVVQNYYDGLPQRYQVTLENGDCVWVNADAVKKL